MKIAILLLTAIAADASNILAVLPSVSRSHNIVHMGLVRTLAAHGHNITVITTTPLNDPKYKHIKVPLTADWEELMNDGTTRIRNMSKITIFIMLLKSIAKLAPLNDNVMRHPKVQEFMNGDNKIDLVILGFSKNEMHLTIPAQLKVPYIWSWIIAPASSINTLTGNPIEASYVPAPYLTSVQPMSFGFRVANAIISAGVYFGDLYGNVKNTKYYK